MAGVEDHHVGVVRHGDQAVAERRQEFGHARRIIDVHLAAIGLDIEPLTQTAVRLHHAHACTPATAAESAAAGCDSGFSLGAPLRSRPESAIATPSAMT